MFQRIKSDSFANGTDRLVILMEMESGFFVAGTEFFNIVQNFGFQRYRHLLQFAVLNATFIL
jgi:hypothetical protein